MKKSNPFLLKVYSHVLQDVAQRVNYSFNRFFKERVNGNTKFGKPQFRKRKEYKSFTYKEYSNGSRFRIENNKLYLARIGYIKAIIDRPIPYNATIKTCTIKKDVNHWYALIVLIIQKHESKLKLDSKKAIGIDVGLRTYGALSNGQKIENPKWIEKYELKLKCEQKRLSRMVKGSNNWKKQCIKIAKIHQKLRFQRRDFLHKETTRLIDNFDIIALEDLQIMNMVKNHNLAKSINDVCWGMFRQFLTYKAEEREKSVVIVNSQNTSQICSRCGEKVSKGLDKRMHECPSCGLILDRDENASLNIIKRGLEKLQSSNDNTAGLAGRACGETSKEAQGSKKIVSKTNS